MQQYITLLVVLLIPFSKILAQGGCYTPTLVGKETACIGSIYEYRISPPAPIPFNWSISSGGTILSTGPGGFSNYIATIQWNSGGPQTVTASCGSYSSTFNVTVASSSPPPTPTSISGNTTACLNNTDTYSISPAPGYSYLWEITQNGYIVNNQTLVSNNNSLDVTWNASGTYNLNVYLSNGSCVGPSQTMVVNVQKSSVLQVSATSSNTCVGGTTTFTANNGGVGESYVWSINGGEQIIGSGNSANVTWGAEGTYTVSVYSTNSCFGNGPTSTINKTIGPSLPVLGAITGPLAPCTNVDQTYSVSPIAGATSYNWFLTSFPNGFTPPTISNNNTYSPSFLFHTPGTYTISVRASNQNCLSNTQSITVNITSNFNTSPTGVILGPNVICHGSNATFISFGNLNDGVPPDAEYTWWSPDDITISNETIVSITLPTIPPSTTYNSQATIGFSSPGWKTIFSNYTAPGGCTSPSSLKSVIVDHPLSPLISGNTTPSCGTTLQYTTGSGGSNYQWTIPTGGIKIAGGTITDNTVTIQWTESTPQNIGVNYTNANSCIADNPGSITVTPYKLAQNVVFPFFPIKSFGQPAISLEANTSAGLPVTYTSSNLAVATLSGNIVTITGAGTVNITASQGGDNCTLPMTNITRSLLVDKGNQTITFDELSMKTFGDSPFSLAATSSSGLPITYVSSNTNVATISGNTVTIVGAGSSNITASQAGNINYNPATSTNRTLTVNKADPLISFDAIPSICPYETSSLTAISTNTSIPIIFGSSNNSVASISSNTLSGVSAGTAIITASQVGNDNYNPATSTQNVTIYSVPIDTITPNGPTTFCSGGSVTLTASSASSYLWSTGATTQSINVSTNGSYSVEVTNASGCQATSSPTNVTVNPNPTVSISGPSTVCGSSASLTASGGTSYIWNGAGITNSTLNPLPINQTGTYYVTTQNSSGCQSVQNSIYVSFNSIPSISISGPPSACNSATLTASGGTSYSWSGPGISGGGSSKTVHSSGLYYVTGYNGGCSSTVSKYVTINYSPPISISQTGGNLCSTGYVNLHVNATAGSTYYWYHNGATTATTWVDSYGSKSVLVTLNGCSVTGSYYVPNPNCGSGGGGGKGHQYRISSDNPDEITGYELIFQPGIYPNPVDNELNVVLEEPVQVHAEITFAELSGKVLATKSIKKGDNKTTIVTENIPDGIYILAILSDSRKKYLKVIVRHSK